MLQKLLRCRGLSPTSPCCVSHPTPVLYPVKQSLCSCCLAPPCVFCGCPVRPQVLLEGEDVYWVDPDTRVSKAVLEELSWAWAAIKACTCCKSLVIIIE
jgi:hypothetical protein